MEDTGSHSPQTAEEFFAQLTLIGGCSDYVIYAHNQDSTALFQISGSGLAEEAYLAGDTILRSYEINPDTDDIQPTVLIKSGSFLTDGFCDCTMENTPVIETEHQAISGTIEIRVIPSGEGFDWGEYPAEMQITMSNLCFDDDRCIESFSVAAGIGWMPG